MWYVPEKFNTKEKAACLKALTYVLNLNNSISTRKNKKDYMMLQLKALGISEDKYNDNQSICSYDNLIKTLRNIESLRHQRYIIREMIMLAVSDQEITDNEIRSIYQIAEVIGISSEKVGDFFIWAAKGIEWNLEGIQLIEEDL